MLKLNPHLSLKDAFIRRQRLPPQINIQALILASLIAGTQSAIAQDKTKKDSFPPESPLTTNQNDPTSRFLKDLNANPSTSTTQQNSEFISSPQSGYFSSSSNSAPLTSSPGFFEDPGVRDKLFWVALMAAGVFGSIYLQRKLLYGEKAPGGNHNSGSPYTLNHKTFKKTHIPSENLSEISGIDDTLNQVYDLISLWKKSIEGEKSYGPRGILLTGGPGLGKTHLAKAIASALQSPFCARKGTDYVARVYVGTGIEKLEDDLANFKKEISEHQKTLKNHPPTKDHKAIGVFFLDEIDAIGVKRGTRFGGGSEDDKMTNLLLTLFDENNLEHDNIIFILTSNRPDILDEALIRSGRIMVLEVSPPRYLEDRLKIASNIASRMLAEREMSFADEEKSLRWLSYITAGCSGADIRECLKEACNICFLNKRKTITLDDIKEAFLRTKAGGRPKKKLSPSESKRVMVHEIGHAIFTCLFEHSRVMIVSNVPRGTYNGVVYSSREEAYEGSHSYDQIIEDALCNMAGTISEAIVYGEEKIGLGGSSDLENTIRRILLLLKTGLLGDTFYIPQEKDVESLPENYIEKVDCMISELRRHTRKILDKLGKDLILEIATACAELDKELVGDEAHDFIMSKIPEEIQDKLKALIKTAVTEMTNSQFGPGYVFREEHMLAAAHIE